MSETNGKNATLKNAALMAGVILLMLVGFEIYLRIGHAREMRAMEERHPNRELYTMRADDPRLVYTLVPNENGANSRGYRDYDYSHPKDSRTFRIIIIGDSVAQGWSLELDEAFGKVLEQKLNADSAFLKYEVVVLARLGYSTSQQLVIFEEEAFEYEPDLILWSYCLNDPAHPFYHNANGELGRYFHRPTLQIGHWFGKRWFHLKQRIRGRRCDNPEFHHFMHCVYWPQVQRDIQRIGEIAEENHVPVVFMIHPVFEERHDDFSDYTLLDVHEKLTGTAADAGLTPLDLLDVFEPYPYEEIKFEWDNWYDPWHPNANGHKIIGDYIFDALVRNGMI